MKEEEFLKELEELGFYDESFKIQIYFNTDKSGNVLINFESIGEQIKKVEQELLSLTEQNI